MFKLLRQYLEKRILARNPYSKKEWDDAMIRLTFLDRLDQTQKDQLIRLSILFLHEKTITGARGFSISHDMRRIIALQACIPILNLGLDWYSGWSTVIVYPDAFQHESTSVDEFGITHTGTRHLSGEAWLRGPVVLSWEEAGHSSVENGRNVVIHEFVHKLDMLNGRANGFPPMQKDMSPAQWSQLMNAAFEDFRKYPKVGIDRYGASDPAEFFAVLSEVFFVKPELLADAYPEIYELMSRFYDQAPLSSVGSSKVSLPTPSCP